MTATVLARNTTLTNTASVSSPTPNPNPANTSASATVTVLATADLVDREDRHGKPDQGGADSYTLTVTNNGPDSAQGVVVNDTLPSQFTATSYTASGAGFTCTLPTAPGGTVVCTNPHAPTASSPVQITITGTVAAGTAADRRWPMLRRSARTPPIPT